MTITSQGKNTRNKREKSKWDEAISDAKQRIRDLQFTIKVYAERRDKGEHWPDDTGEPLSSST